MATMTWINVAGGIMLILFGGRFLRKGLDRLFGAQLGGILRRLTGHPLRAFGAGLGIAVLTPSSTTVRFSAEGWGELDRFYEQVGANLLLAELVFQSGDQAQARELLARQERLNSEYRRLRDRHLARLNAGLAQSHESSAIHLDLLAQLKRINTCAAHIAYGVQPEEPTAPTPAPTPAQAGPLPGSRLQPPGP